MLILKNIEICLTIKLKKIILIIRKSDEQEEYIKFVFDRELMVGGNK